MRLAIVVLLSGLVVAALAMPVIYSIAVTTSPPFTSDGHRVMPIGQVGVALIGGILLGIVAAVLVAQRGSRRRR